LNVPATETLRAVRTYPAGGLERRHVPAPVQARLADYLITGIAVAWDRGYITVHLLKLIVSALLAIFLWWLVLLGVNVHIH
jgi:hypothetical protein